MEALRAVGRAALAAMFVTGGADALLDPGPRAAELGCRSSRSWRSGGTVPSCWPAASPWPSDCSPVGARRPAP
jgi:hypothetical protein